MSTLYHPDSDDLKKKLEIFLIRPAFHKTILVGIMYAKILIFFTDCVPYKPFYSFKRSWY